MTRYIQERTSQNPCYSRHETNMDWSNQIRQAIAATGLSCYEIAKRSGVSQQVIGRFVRKERSLTLKTAEKLGSSVGLIVVQENTVHSHKRIKADVRKQSHP